MLVVQYAELADYEVLKVEIIEMIQNLKTSSPVAIILQIRCQYIKCV